MDSTGKRIGENSITKIESGCILHERYKTDKSYSGSSYSYYNQTDSTWNQLWVDHKGNHLDLKGRGTSGKMVLKSEITESDKGDYYDQITWIKLSQVRVILLRERFTPKGNKITTVFKCSYIRKDY